MGEVACQAAQNAIGGAIVLIICAIFLTWATITFFSPDGDDR